MKQSEFWNAVDEVYGAPLGRSIVTDLYLPQVRATAVEALDAGVDPENIWEALISETGQSEQARWIYRIDLKDRR